MFIGVTDTGGKRREYRVKPLDDLTVRDWVAIASPPIGEEITEDYERLLILTARHTTIPRKALDKMPARDVRMLMDAMAVMLEEVRVAIEKADKELPPRSFTFRKVTYNVPQNIEADLTFGQYESLTKVLLPKCETDADGYAAILAVCCWPEGEAFDAAKLTERMDLFMDMPVRTAFQVCAFFFDNSDLLRTSINLIVDRSRSLHRHRIEQALSSMRSSTVA